MNLHDLKLRIRAMVKRRQAERDLHDELAFHVDREAQKLIDAGVAPAAARARARTQFGRTAVADECRDQRGTAFVDNAIRDGRYALRSFAHAPLAALTVIVTVAIGLAVVAVLFTFLNTFLFRVDRVPDVAQFYALERQAPGGEGQSPFARAEFDSVRRDTCSTLPANLALSPSTESSARAPSSMPASSACGTKTSA